MLKLSTANIFKYCFATCLIEAGHDIRTIQELFEGTVRWKLIRANMLNKIQYNLLN